MSVTEPEEWGPGIFDNRGRAASHSLERGRGSDGGADEMRAFQLSSYRV